MRWVLIGASDIAATRVLPALRTLGHEPVGVMSSSPERAERYAGEHGLCFHTTDLAEALAWEADTVYISTTNGLHAGQAIAAARAGRHILCEKPLALQIDDAHAMIAATRDAGVVLATNHHLRCAATVRAVARLVAEGRVGKLVSLRVNHAVLLPERLRGWRLDRSKAGGGVVLDITVHDADVVRFVSGDEIEEVRTLVANGGMAADGIEDTAMTVARLRAGALVTTHESFTVPAAQTSLEVHGSDGSIYATGVLTQDPVGSVVLRTPDGEEQVEVGEREDLYVVALREFAAAVRGEGRPAASGEDGAASLAVALAALESAQRGGAVRPVFQGAGA
jgi:1,5-anhydro-D-fructose reductase (1,5-anhydro-D-mannitol-forming)